METNHSIYVKNLTRYYGAIAAIKNVSFNVNRGEIVGFLGPNGAGKSTTMRILSGLLPASSGSAWISGTSVAQNPSEVKRRIGFMPENNPLPEDMRVVEYLRFRGRLKEIPGRKLRASVQDVMEVCDLARTARRKIIGTLSKGFRQRVGIADALLGDPEVIIMDEPTIGLDPHQIQGIRKLIDSLRGRLTVVLSSHILPEIERSCDRVIIINRGRVVASGTSTELREEFLPGQRFQVEAEASEESLMAAFSNQGIDATLLETNPGTKGRTLFNIRAEGNGLLGNQLINALAQGEGCTLHSLAPKEANLEEIFLAATKRSWEETIENKPTANMIKEENKAKKAEAQ